MGLGLNSVLYIDFRAMFLAVCFAVRFRPKPIIKLLQVKVIKNLYKNHISISACQYFILPIIAH
jgi:hypothetical protein